MIRVNINETFPIAVTLVDEVTAVPATGKTVYYDVRLLPGDVVLAPPLDGVLPESPVEPGIYKALASIDEAGTYMIYATCSGFLANTEEIIVTEFGEEVLPSVYANRHYNISVEDVIRTTNTPTANQALRNIPKGKTDYIITKIKRDEDTDWSDPVAQGNVYAWYRSDKDKVPYKMGGSS